MALWCTKQSFEPSSGVMKPKPLLSLNHFTVPIVRIYRTPEEKVDCRGGPVSPYSPTVMFCGHVNRPPHRAFSKPKRTGDSSHPRSSSYTGRRAETLDSPLAEGSNITAER